LSRAQATACAAMVAALMLPGCDYMARKTLSTGPNGPQTPASVGLAFERVAIASGGRRLDGYVVPAAPQCADAPVLLIYHGVQETISLWVGAQALLHRHCVSSLVFDYSGSGDSSRPASMGNVNQDAIAAYEFARVRFPGARLYIFGHSMGNGIMLDALPGFSRPPEGVVVANAFASLRDLAGRSSAIYSFLMRFTPDWWDNVKTVAALHRPLLVLNSDADTIAPVEDGRRIFASANEPKRFVPLHGYRHNALYREAGDDWWGETLRFIGAAS